MGITRFFRSKSKKLLGYKWQKLQPEANKTELYSASGIF